jgi:glutamyl/glutaminyl-tRNA synthetase
LVCSLPRRLIEADLSGFTPKKITYSSDNFQRLYDLAEKLIRLEKAYVCHCSEAEIKMQRGGEERGPRFRCEHAAQDVETNLAKFRDMRDGKYEPQTAFLRMKQDIESGNPQMCSSTIKAVDCVDGSRGSRGLSHSQESHEAPPDGR